MLTRFPPSPRFKIVKKKKDGLHAPLERDYFQVDSGVKDLVSCLTVFYVLYNL